MILSELLENKSIEVRKLIIEMLYLAGSGHPGSSLAARLIGILPIERDLFYLKGMQPQLCIVPWSFLG